jgi:hypothetical protein
MAAAPIPPGRLLADVVAYQIGWLGCVLGAARGHAWAGVTAAVALAAFHLALLDGPERRRNELRLFAASVVVGLVVDGTLTALGWVRYPEGQPAPFLPPVWMLCLWMLFATLLPGALAWLRGRPILAAALGALGGPLAYLAGERLGAIALARGPGPLLALAVAWAVAIPLLLGLSRKLVPDGA